MNFSLNLIFFFFFLYFKVIICRNYNLTLISEYLITAISETAPTLAPTTTITAYSWLNTTQSILSDSYPLKLYIDPPEGYFSPTALGVFMRCISVKGTSTETKVYYTVDGDEPTKIDSYTTYQEPYVHIITPYQVGRSRVFKAVCIEKGIDGNTYRSELLTRHYTIEAASRPSRYI